MADDDNVLLFPGRSQPQPTKAFVAISLNARGTFDVAVYDGRPGEAATTRMYCGPRPTLLEAWQYAREKALALGTTEIVDWSSFEPPEGAA